MKIKSKFKFLSKLAAVAAAAVVPATASAVQGDADLLSILVKKGTLTAEEANEIKKSSAVAPVFVEQGNPVIRISGKFQGQYEYLYVNGLEGVDGSATVSKFIPRRVILTFKTDEKRDWGAQLSFDFILPHKMSVTYMWKRVETSYAKGEFRFGYVKSNFNVEEYMSPFNLYCVERSIATYYWGGPKNARRLGLASFHTGAYWLGKSQIVDGLNYVLGVSNAKNYEISQIDSDNAPNLYFAVSQKLDFDDVKILLGVNLGWGADANGYAANSSTAGMWGANPYASLDWNALRAMAEFLVSGVDEGRNLDGSYGRQFPVGLNAMVEYKFDIGEFGKLAPAFRFTYLDTDGRGVTPSDGLRHTKNIAGDSPYKRATGYYGGVNWYLHGNNLKFMLGYEYTHFDGGAYGAHEAEENSVRSMVQVLF